VNGTTKQWADGPFQLLETPRHANNIDETKEDRYIKAASEMAVTHNIIIRGLNSIYLQAPHVQPKDYVDFIGYCLCWGDVLHAHHYCEETIAFPEIEKSSEVKGIMDVNVHQHVPQRRSRRALKIIKHISWTPKAARQPSPAVASTRSLTLSPPFFTRI